MRIEDYELSKLISATMGSNSCSPEVWYSPKSAELICASCDIDKHRSEYFHMNSYILNPFYTVYDNFCPNLFKNLKELHELASCIVIHNHKNSLDNIVNVTITDAFKTDRVYLRPLITFEYDITEHTILEQTIQTTFMGTLNYDEWASTLR